MPALFPNLRVSHNVFYPRCRRIPWCPAPGCCRVFHLGTRVLGSESNLCFSCPRPDLLCPWPRLMLVKCAGNKRREGASFDWCRPVLFLFLCVFWSFFERFYRVTGNGHHNIEFKFVDLEHAELCLKSPIHDISCYLSGNNGCKILL